MINISDSRNILACQLNLTKSLSLVDYGLKMYIRIYNGLNLLGWRHILNDWVSYLKTLGIQCSGTMSETHFTQKVKLLDKGANDVCQANAWVNKISYNDVANHISLNQREMQKAHGTWLYCCRGCEFWYLLSYVYLIHSKLKEKLIRVHLLQQIRQWECWNPKGSTGCGPWELK